MAGVLYRNTLQCIVTKRGMRLLGCVVTQGHDTAQGRARVRCDTGPWACDTARPGCGTADRKATTRSGRAYDTAPARAGWPGCSPVHPTSFWTQCTVPITIWDTVHEHYS